MIEAIFNFLPYPLAMLFGAVFIVGISFGSIALFCAFMYFFFYELPTNPKFALTEEGRKKREEERERLETYPSAPRFGQNPHLLPKEDQQALFNRGYPGFYPDYWKDKGQREQRGRKTLRAREEFTFE